MAAAEITRSEAAERARLLQVDSYDVALDLTRGTEIFGSAAVIRFGCREPGTASYADLVAREIREITLNGVAVDPARCAGGRIPLAGLAERNELRVVADCEYSRDGTGLHRSADSADGRVYTYTSFEPAEARRVYANFEQPDLKAAFTFHVTAPAHWTVLSNQPAPEPEPAGAAGPGPAGEAAATWHFPPTPPISTYLTAVVAGEYHLVRDSHTTSSGQVIPLGLACRASLAEYLETADLIKITRQGFDYFTALFGSDYPFAKYDQVFVPEFLAGAMENVGCVTISEQLLFRSKVTDMMYELRADAVLHEMAHMWFGNLVTMRWWDDLWLNESFAEYCATQACAEATRFTGIWASFSGSRKTWGYMQDRLPSTHPVAADVATLTEAVANFDGISYAKGASVLRQLVAHVGRDAFFAGISSYFASHGWGNATLADLLAAIEAAAGMDLADWSRAWLQTAGPNTLRCEFEVDGAGAFTQFAVRQEAPPEHPTLRPHHIAIGLYQRAGGALTRVHRVEVEADGPRTPVPELAGVTQPDLVLLNDGDLDYALVRFDPRSLATVTSSIGEFTDALARAVCWTAAADMVQQAEMSLPAFVTMLVHGMPAEPSVSVLQILHMIAGRLFRQAGDPVWVPEGRRQLAQAATRLLAAAEPGSDHQLAWAELLAWTAVAPGELDLLARLLDGREQLPGLRIDAELRWALLRRLAATGRAGEDAIEAEARRDPTDAGRRHAAACRAALPDAAHKAAAWQLLTGGEELSAEAITEIAHSFSQPEHAELLAPYTGRYFEALPRLWAQRGAMLRVVLGEALFPYPAASPALLAQVDALLARPELDPGLRRLLLERRDIVARTLRSRELAA